MHRSRRPINRRNAACHRCCQRPSR